MTRFTLVFVLVLVAARALHGQARSEAGQHVATLRKAASGKRSFSGIYPHLASFNRQNECGTGAVVPWAGRLWWVTYAPHKPDGSDDKLYATNAARELFIADGSIGGTPANRLIHRESQQLFIGPYAIDAGGKVRVIPYSRMRGRPTGTARHLTDPAGKVYYATMEEGLYEVDVKTLAVKELFADTHQKRRADEAMLPGYHGKGLYSGQGVLVYSNNGEYGAAAKKRPDVPSGVLAEWRGKGDWQVVRRNQFTDVTGPGGIHGNAKPATDPLWSIGWDHRSLLLMLRSATLEGEWFSLRLPKGSHSYDGAHGWNTEWPRIRDIGEDDLLMTMHGTFWRFPRGFDIRTMTGITPRSNYLKVVGDFCRWGDEVVLGCDDAARSEFLNKRRAKGEIAGPAESQSNLWFVAPGDLDRLGPVIGRGGVFVDERIKAQQRSVPYLFEGYAHRGVHLTHDAPTTVVFTFEAYQGVGKWREIAQCAVAKRGYAFHAFDAADEGAWIRARASRRCRTTVWFEYRDDDPRTAAVGAKFGSLARTGQPALGGLVRAGDRQRGLQILATRVASGRSEGTGYYELEPDLVLRRVEAGKGQRTAAWMQKRVAIPKSVVRRDGDSMLYVDDAGRRWRLPIGNPAFRKADGSDLQRTAREVATERDLFHCGGTFFELPARNAGGFVKLRPIATHPFFVHDFGSWRGLLVMTGVSPDAKPDPHVIRSKDGKCAVWLGAIDDLWQLGKPRGTGGPWSATPVEAGVPSDPYLMTGYDRKSVRLSHDLEVPVAMSIEVDITGTGQWCSYRTLTVPPGKGAQHEFPRSFAAYWVRVVADAACRASARFAYR